MATILTHHRDRISVRIDGVVYREWTGDRHNAKAVAEDLELTSRYQTCDGIVVWSRPEPTPSFI